MGNTDSDWEGVSWTTTANIATGNTYALTGVQATNTDFVNASTSKYTDNTFFFGIIDYTASTPIVKVIRQTPRTEQDTTDGTVDRIEYGRALKMAYKVSTSKV